MSATVASLTGAGFGYARCYYSGPRLSLGKKVKSIAIFCKIFIRNSSCIYNIAALRKSYVFFPRSMRAIMEQLYPVQSCLVY